MAMLNYVSVKTTRDGRFEAIDIHVNIVVLRYEPIPTNKDAAEAFDEAVAAWVEAQ